MKLPNFLQPKEQTYLLETVNEVHVARNPKRLTLKGGFSRTKKAVAVVALALTFGATFTTASLVSSTNSEQAYANIFEDIGRNAVCVTQDNPKAPYGGDNEALSRGLSNPNGSFSVEENIINATPGPQDDNGNPSAQWTALEEYGYFLPYYSSWNGASPENNESGYFAGTGGQGANGYGPLVLIENARTNPLFSSSVGECVFGGTFNAGFANAVAWLPKLAVAITGEIYQWSFTTTLTNPESPLFPVAEGIERVIVGDPATGTPGLKDALFLDFLVPIIMFGAIGLIWTGIIKRSSIQAAQSALWMVGAAVAGIVFLVAPLQIVKVIDDTVVNVTAAISDTALAGDNASDFCELPAGAEDRTVRQIKCSVWYTTIYVPWVKGQFGVDQYKLGQSEYAWMYADPGVGGAAAYSNDDPNGSGWDNVDLNGPRSDGTRGVWANFNPTLGTAEAPVSSKNWAYYQMHSQANREAGEGVNISEVAYNQLVINSNPIWKNADGAIGGAFLTLIGSIGPVAVIASVSFTIIAYQITMLILIALSPLFFLVGVAPGWGRRIAMRWLELMVGLLAKRIILTIFLLLFLKIYGIILQAEMDAFFQTALVLILAFAALTQRQKIVAIFTDSINFGGDKRLGDDGSVVGAMRKAGSTVASKANQLSGRAAKGVVNSQAIQNVKRKTGGVRADATSTVIDKIGEGRRTKKEAKFGVDTNNNQVADTLKKVDSYKDLNLDTLDKRTRSSLLGADGKVDAEKADTYTVKKMNEYSTRNERLTHLAEENRKKREKLREIADLKKRAHERERLRLERDNVRKEQKRLNSEVKTTFKDVSKKKIDPKPNPVGDSLLSPTGN